MSIREDITEHFREAIITGGYPPGSTLPPTLEIAKTFSTQPCNVQRALTRLVEEGFIERAPRIGTRVRERRRDLRSVAIVTDMQGHSMRPYAEYFMREFTARLTAEGIEFRILNDDETGHCRDAVRRLVGSDRVQAVFLVEPLEEHVPGFQAIPAPVLGLSGNHTLPRVDFDHHGMLKLLIGELRRSGISRLGALELISPLHDSPFSDCCPGLFNALFADNGIELVRPAFRNCPTWPRLHDYHRLGYESMRSLAAMPNPPEGLLVYPDWMVPGVIAAAYKLKIDLNRMFKRIFIHRNAELPVLFPGRADFLEIRLTETVEAAIKLLHNLYAGREPRVFRIEHHLIQGGD